MKNNKKGFTLVELLVVIAILAILATVAVVGYMSFIDRANQSVDQQLVEQMNITLQADEVLNGKPATVVDAKNILVANRLDDFTPIDARNVFYWVGTENRVILWSKDEADGTTGRVTYPEDYVEKFADYTEPSSDWADLSLDYISGVNYFEVGVSEGETLKDALINTIKSAPDGAIIKLPADSVAQMAQGGLYWLGESLKVSGIGKRITIDLNGNTIESSGTNARFTRTEDGSGWQTDADGDYVMNILTVPTNGELVLTNGAINIEHGEQAALASLIVDSGGKLVLRNIQMDTTTAGVMPAGDASEVVIENSTINALNYALGTNRMESNNIRIVIGNSTLSSTYATAVLINTPSYTTIYDSTITGVVHGIALRTGHLTITDSTIVTTDTEPGIYSYKNFAPGYNFSGWWKDGNTMPGGTLVVGDYATANNDGPFSYSGDVSVEMTNVKLQSADPNAVPTILLAASDPAKKVSVVYDASSNITNAIVYGSNWESDEVVDFNHLGTITVNGESKTLN